MTMFRIKPSEKLFRLMNDKRTLAEKIKAAKFNEKQKECLIECISHAHMRGVRYATDTKCRENLAFVLKEIKLVEGPPPSISKAIDYIANGSFDRDLKTVQGQQAKRRIIGKRK